LISAKGGAIGDRDTLVVLLALASGSVDALCFLALGGVFASLMSGNAIILGLRIGQGSLVLASHSLVPILAYMGGVALGANITGPRKSAEELWPRKVTRMFTMELALITVFAVGAFLTNSPPSQLDLYVLVALASIPMGMQSAGVHALGVPGVSTTYITGTLTSAVIGLVGLGRSPASKRTLKQEKDTSLQIIVLILYIFGAAVGGLAGTQFALKAALIPAAVIGLVVVVATLHAR